MRRAVIQFVRRTAFFPLFRSLYHGYYRFSTLAFVLSLRRFPEIQSIFANRSYPGEGWIPGYSDIDLVITLQAMEPDAEVLALHRIWRRINGVRRLFPLVTTVHLLTREELEKWARVGKIRRCERDRWQDLLLRCEN